MRKAILYVVASAALALSACGQPTSPAGNGPQPWIAATAVGIGNEKNPRHD